MLSSGYSSLLSPVDVVELLPKLMVGLLRKMVKNRPSSTWMFVGTFVEMGYEWMCREQPPSSRQGNPTRRGTLGILSALWNTRDGCRSISCLLPLSCFCLWSSPSL